MLLFLILLDIRNSCSAQRQAWIGLIVIVCALYVSPSVERPIISCYHIGSIILPNIPNNRSNNMSELAHKILRGIHSLPCSSRCFNGFNSLYTMPILRMKISVGFQVFLYSLDVDFGLSGSFPILVIFYLLTSSRFQSKLWIANFTLQLDHGMSRMEVRKCVTCSDVITT